MGPRPTREFLSFNLGSWNWLHITVVGVHILYKLNCAYLAHTSLNSLYIPLSVLPVVEISTALE